MNLPRFVLEGGFNWAAAGYHYRLGQAERARIMQSPRLDEPWELLARTVELAKTGDFSSVGLVPGLFHSRHDTNVAPSALLVAGDIGSHADLSALTQVLRSGSDGLKVYASQAARNAGCLWLVPSMLDAWEGCSGLDAHEQIGFALSDLLDVTSTLEDVGPIANAASHYDIRIDPKADTGLDALKRRIKGSRRPVSDFRALVEARYTELLDVCGSDKLAVWRGTVFNVRRLCEGFLSAITSPTFDLQQSPLTVSVREKIEASTGLDCGRWYSEGRFVQGAAVDALERFLDDGGALRCVDGSRYFFGHLLN